VRSERRFVLEMPFVSYALSSIGTVLGQVRLIVHVKLDFDVSVIPPSQTSAPSEIRSDRVFDLLGGVCQPDGLSAERSGDGT
jgi:hypothetical protein